MSRRCVRQPAREHLPLSVDGSQERPTGGSSGGSDGGRPKSGGRAAGEKVCCVMTKTLIPMSRPLMGQRGEPEGLSALSEETEAL